MTRLASSILVLGLSLSSATVALAQGSVLEDKAANAICALPEISRHNPQLVVIVNNVGDDRVAVCGKYTKRDITYKTRSTLDVSNPCVIYTTTSGFKIYIGNECPQ